jgi:hypothetical protein
MEKPVAVASVLPTLETIQGGVFVKCKMMMEPNDEHSVSLSCAL